MISKENKRVVVSLNPAGTKKLEFLRKKLGLTKTGLVNYAIAKLYENEKINKVGK